MTNRRILDYNWEYGTEKIMIDVGKNEFGGLYVGMLCEIDGNLELFSDLTKNIPGYELAYNEAYITHEFSECKLAFIEKYKLGVIKPSYAQSGFCTYCKVAFDLKRLKELDPEGMKQFMQQMGIELG